MHEFDRCQFCSSFNGEYCIDEYCVGHSDYVMDVKKIIAKADEMGVHINDVVALIKECNKKRW